MEQQQDEEDCKRTKQARHQHTNDKEEEEKQHQRGNKSGWNHEQNQRQEKSRRRRTSEIDTRTRQKIIITAIEWTRNTAINVLTILTIYGVTVTQKTSRSRQTRRTGNKFLGRTDSSHGKTRLKLRFRSRRNNSKTRRRLSNSTNGLFQFHRQEKNRPKYVQQKLPVIHSQQDF